jgi:uncharacterized protein (TIGR02147 family)
MDTYQKILTDEIARKCLQNPQYSLRALARHTGLSPSHLSRVTRGKGRITVKTALAVSVGLGLSPAKRKLFLDLVKSKNGKSEIKNPPTKNRVTLEMDSFQIISDWYCLPLLELFRSKKFRSCPKWLAHKFSISVHEVRSTLEKFKALGLIEIDSHGEIALVDDHFLETLDDIPHTAVKSHHEGMIRRSLDALRLQEAAKREFQSLNLRFDPKKIKQAKAMIRDFVNKFETRFQSADSGAVFQLNAQFFSLTKEDEI